MKCFHERYKPYSRDMEVYHLLLATEKSVFLLHNTRKTALFHLGFQFPLQKSYINAAAVLPPTSPLLFSHTESGNIHKCSPASKNLLSLKKRTCSTFSWYRHPLWSFSTAYWSSRYPFTGSSFPSFNLQGHKLDEIFRLPCKRAQWLLHMIWKSGRLLQISTMFWLLKGI